MIRTKSAAFQLDRERLRILIARQWRSVGRSWSDAEIEAAIDEAIKRRVASSNDAAAEHQPVQMAMFDADDATKKTRASAAASSLCSGPTRRERIAQFLAAQGSKGATRDEIAIALGLKIQSVCPLVKSMERAGRLLPTNRTRLTSSGEPAVVLVAPKYALSRVGGER